jgi:hypothetical protein
MGKALRETCIECGGKTCAPKTQNKILLKKKLRLRRLLAKGRAGKVPQNDNLIVKRYGKSFPMGMKANDAIGSRKIESRPKTQTECEFVFLWGWDWGVRM